MDWYSACEANMTSTDNKITVVRIYLTEGETQLKTLIKRLHDWEKLRGLTVFRGITGYGESGTIHGADIMDLSLHLPVVVEFFDDPEKVNEIWQHLQAIIKPGHMVRWDAEINS
jgi:PII-like signaling protein